MTQGEGWERYTVTAKQCPRISEEFLEAERKALGPLFFQSEYLCRFVDTIGAIFSNKLIRAALDPTVLPLFTGEDRNGHTPFRLA